MEEARPALARGREAGCVSASDCRVSKKAGGRHGSV